MSLRTDINIEGSQNKTKGPHPDYRANFDSSITFMNNVKNSLLNGMTVSITDADKNIEGLRKCLFNIGFKAPTEDHPCKARYWTPISMHQPKREFGNQVETVFNQYMNLVKGFEDEIPRMVQKDLLEGKV